MASRVNVFVVFQRFQMSNHFRRFAQLPGQAFFQCSRQAVRFSDGSRMGKEQMHFDDLAVSRRAIADSVIVHS